METNPQKLNGPWKEGWALDLHTLYSIPIEPEWGIYDTNRTPIAKELYLLKYKNQKDRVENIAIVAAEFLTTKKNDWSLDVIIPIPPSDMTRKFQPVYEMAISIGERVKLPVDFNTLKKEKNTSQLKKIFNPEKRREVLNDAFTINSNALIGKNVLLFDDLYRSGETLKAVYDVIKNKGKAKEVYVLTITKTRSKR